MFGPGLKWDRRGLSAVLPCNLFSMHSKALCGYRNLLICVQWIAYDRLYPDVFRPKEFSFTRLHPLPPERYAEPSPCPVSLFICCFICLFVSWISYLVFHLLPYAYLGLPLFHTHTSMSYPCLHVYTLRSFSFFPCRAVHCFCISPFCRMFVIRLRRSGKGSEEWYRSFPINLQLLSVCFYVQNSTSIILPCHELHSVAPSLRIPII